MFKKVGTIIVLTILLRIGIVAPTRNAITTEDGNIWLVDNRADLHQYETVVVAFDDNGTQMPEDDVIVSIWHLQH